MLKPPKNPLAAIHAGCAGWKVAAVPGVSFDGEGTHLQRYAAVLPAVEINSSFYRAHRPATYVRWKDSVPDDFRFSVKVPKQITHTQRLRDAEAPLTQFLFEAGHLGRKLGCLLVQLPPSLIFDADIARTFFALLRQQFDGAVVCEPRHATWLRDDAVAMLSAYSIAYVAADPSPLPAVADAAKGTIELPGLVRAVPDTGAAAAYLRLHGSPAIYRSSYGADFLASLAVLLQKYRQAGRDVWCIFDNTAEGAALRNVLQLHQMLSMPRLAGMP